MCFFSADINCNSKRKITNSRIIKNETDSSKRLQPHIHPHQCTHSVHYSQLDNEQNKEEYIEAKYKRKGIVIMMKQIEYVY